MYASALEIEPNNANAADDLQKLDRISRELDAGAESDEDGLGCHLGPGVGVGRLLCGLTMLANARILSATHPGNAHLEGRNFRAAFTCFGAALRDAPDALELRTKKAECQVCPLPALF